MTAISPALTLATVGANFSVSGPTASSGVDAPAPERVVDPSVASRGFDWSALAPIMGDRPPPSNRAGAGISPTGPTLSRPESNAVLAVMGELGVDWQLASIICSARQWEEFASETPSFLTAAGTRILDVLGRFQTAGEIDRWYAERPFFGTTRPIRTVSSNDPSYPGASLDDASSFSPVTYQLSDSASRCDKGILSAFSGWAPSTPLPLASIYSGLSAVKAFTEEWATRAYCYSRISAEDLRLVRDYSPLLADVPEADVVKRAILTGQPAPLALLTTYNERVALPADISLKVHNRMTTNATGAHEEETTRRLQAEQLLKLQRIANGRRASERLVPS